MQYFLSGFSLIQQKGLKRFVFIPLIINFILFGLAFYWLSLQLSGISDWVYNALPSWLTWLSYLVSPIIIISTIMVFTFIFTTIANFIAAPFNGLLAEKTERVLTGQDIEGDPLNAKTIGLEINRTLKREWQKVMYFIPRALGFLILFWILPIIGQMLWFVFSSWMMAIQYADYPFDNHKINFQQMRSSLWQHKLTNISFGATVVIFSMIPILNLLVMPIAVCGATKMWVDKYRP